MTVSSLFSIASKKVYDDYGQRINRLTTKKLPAGCIEAVLKHSEQDEDEKLPLHIAIRIATDFQTIKNLATPDNVTKVDTSQNTALHEAILFRNYQAVNYLSKTYPSLLNKTNDNGCNPFRLSLHRRDLRSALYILKNNPKMLISKQTYITLHKEFDLIKIARISTLASLAILSTTYLLKRFSII